MSPQDFRHALRTFARNPGFTAVAVGTLALGIGAASAIFSVADGVLFQPLPYPEPERLVAVWEHDRLRGTEKEGLSVPDFLDFRERGRTLRRLAAWVVSPANLSLGEGETAQVATAGASRELFEVLGIRPLAGRAFAAEEDRPGGERVALLAEELWRLGFGADPGLVGRRVLLDDQPVLVVGIVPAGIELQGPPVDLWLPLQASPDALRGRHGLAAVAELTPGATLQAAQREMSALAADLEREHPEDNLGRGVTLVPLAEELLGPVRPAILALLAAVGLLLLIACANVANLLLARATARQREVAVRAALGAGRGRLVRQFLAEALALTGAAAAVGLLGAAWAVDLLRAHGPEDVPRLAAVALDGRALAFTLLVALATGVVFGLVPALGPGARRLGALRGGRTEGAGAQRGRDLLVVAEVALSCVLVVGAGLLVRSLWQLLAVDPGFRPAGVLRVELQLPASRYPQSFAEFPRWPEVAGFYAELLERVEGLPGVRAAAVAHSDPLTAGWTTRFTIEGRPEVPEGEREEINLRPASPGYLAAAGVPLLRGRTLAPADRVDAPPVLLINQAAARRWFPGEDPVGQHMTLFGVRRRIVGVVGDERFQGLAEEAPPAAYPPIAQVPMPGASLLVRTAGDPLTTLPAVRAAIHALDPDLAIPEAGTLAGGLAEATARPRFNALLLGAFAAVALLLAAVGVYGLLSFAVARRTREIGVRMALGAGRRQVVGQVVGRGMTLAMAGLALGLAGSLAATRLLSSLLFGVGPTDLPTFAAVAALLAAAALLASLLPARRAARVDPQVALRTE